jgi:hypothetical protein
MNQLRLKKRGTSTTPRVPIKEIPPNASSLFAEDIEQKSSKTEVQPEFILSMENQTIVTATSTINLLQPHVKPKRIIPLPEIDPLLKTAFDTKKLSFEEEKEALPVFNPKNFGLQIPKSKIAASNIQCEKEADIKSPKLQYSKPAVKHADDLEESAFSDYDDMPVDEFGAALLRGMGWLEPTTAEKDEKQASQVKPRPPRLGLGAQVAP